MLYQKVTLSLDTLATVWQRENLGDMHNVLVDTPVWRDETPSARPLHTATGELAQRGLLAGRDLHPDLRDTLNLLARPSIEYYGWISYTDAEHGPVSIAVLVAAIGRTRCWWCATARPCTWSRRGPRAWPRHCSVTCRRCRRRVAAR